MPAAIPRSGPLEPDTNDPSINISMEPKTIVFNHLLFSVKKSPKAIKVSSLLLPYPFYYA